MYMQEPDDDIIRPERREIEPARRYTPENVQLYMGDLGGEMVWS